MFCFDVNEILKKLKTVYIILNNSVQNAVWYVILFSVHIV